MRSAFLLPLALLAGAAPAAGLSTTTAPVAQTAIDSDQVAYRAIFAAIHAQDWATAAAGIDARPDAPLAAVARAELLLGKSAPQADAVTLASVIARAPDLPQAPALARLARAKGVSELAPLPLQHDLVRYAGASKRLSARPGRGDAITAQLVPLVKVNDGAAAEPLLEAAAGQLAPDTLTEWRQRIAWAYFLGGDDAGARRMAALARTGQGEWAVQADWIAGLAAWRAGDMAAAADCFAAVAGHAHDPEMVAAGLYWGARSDLAGGRPHRVAPQLRSAARAGETFYGMLATAALGLPVPAAGADGDTRAIDGVLARPNVRTAAALAAIGETDLADRLLRHQARIGDPAEHGALIRVAERLSLPATQVWLAGNGPPGGSASAAARFPAPAWSPSGGWRVDRALLMAHALQESQFRTDAVSRAGARGLMQLMPGTARLVARHKGDTSGSADRLGDPAISFEYGQSYLEELAGNAGTGGLLPKVIAAYNAGPNNVAVWGLRPGVAADPLLFVESIPFAETRAYVAIVLRNYWMYQRQTGTPSESLAALAQGKWPMFPRAGSKPVSRATTGAAAGAGIQ